MLLLVIEFASAGRVKVFCDVQLGDIPNGFTLAANLKIDENSGVTTTEAIVTLKDFYAAQSESNPIVVSSQGTYRQINALGGYVHTLLIPLSVDSKILSLDLKLNINQNYQSVIELDQTSKYYSNCRTVANSHPEEKVKGQTQPIPQPPIH